MPKNTSKSIALSLITQKLEAKKKLNKPEPFYEKSPEHLSSPSSASEEEDKSTEQNQNNEADNVSRELDMEGEEYEEKKIAEEDKQPSDDEQATKSDGTAKVPEATDPITLDEILTQAGVSIQERKTIKEDLSFWWFDDLVDLAPADIITEPQYCSRKARQALYFGTPLHRS